MSRKTMKKKLGRIKVKCEATFNPEAFEHFILLMTVFLWLDAPENMFNFLQFSAPILFPELSFIALVCYVIQ